MGEGSVFRDYRGVKGAVEDAEKGKPSGETKFERGRWGGSETKSPRPGVRDPGEPREGEHGEKAYGPPTSTPPPQPRSERERKAKPDPLKKK